MNGKQNTDPWAHRAAGMKCKTCRFYVAKMLDDGTGASTLGRCRRHAPIMTGFVPVFETDWCGDHRLDENHVGSRTTATAEPEARERRNQAGLDPVPGVERGVNLVRVRNESVPVQIQDVTTGHVRWLERNHETSLHRETETLRINELTQERVHLPDGLVIRTRGPGTEFGLRSGGASAQGDGPPAGD